MSDFRRPRSLFWPVLLVIVGVFLFLVNMDTIQGTIWENVSIYWPVIFIIGGLDGLYQGERWVGAIVLLGLGTILLLGNLGRLPVDGWESLIRLWPVLLIGFGLDIAFGKRYSIWNAILRVAIGLSLVAGIVWIILASPFGLVSRQVHFDQSLDGAARSEITFSIPVGNLAVKGGADPKTLVSGTADLPKNVDLNTDFTKSADGSSKFYVEWMNTGFLPTGLSTLPWNIRLNSEIPIDLLTDFGIGKLDVDLSKVTINAFTNKVGIGKVAISLPCANDASVYIENGIGLVDLYIPESCNVNIDLKTGLVFHDLPSHYLRTNDNVRNEGASMDSPELDINISLAMGLVHIHEVP